MFRRFWIFLASTRLTLCLLAAAFVLVLAGTLAQVEMGTQAAVERFFQSFFVHWNGVPVFPGGHLLGGALVVNLLAAEVQRFRLRGGGLWLHGIHGGLILLLVGGLFTDLLSQESLLTLREGETRDYTEDTRLAELVWKEKLPDGGESETVIPEQQLRIGAPICPGDFPFQITVRRFYDSASLARLDPADRAAQPVANQGLGKYVSLEKADTGRGWKSVVMELSTPEGQTLGTWLVSTALTVPQTVAIAGRTWEVALQPVRHYLPFRLTLQKFTHETHPGTDIPRTFSSQLILEEGGGAGATKRDVLISMNHPLRTGQTTFYQSGYGPDGHSTILQVVHNPAFVAPYIACGVISLGLLGQFARRKYEL